MDTLPEQTMSLPPIHLPLISAKQPTRNPASQGLSDDDRYALFLAHTPTTSFLVGVKTTKIFCRTDCPARRARRANVRFFQTVADAQGEGFRACKRCKPEGMQMAAENSRGVVGIGRGEKVGEGGEQSARLRAAQRAQRVILEKEGRVPWREVSKEVGLSPRYLFEAFKGVVGCTPGVWAEKVKKGEISGSTLVGQVDAGSLESGEETTPIDFNLDDWMASQEMRDYLDEYTTPGLASSSSGLSAGTPLSDAMLQTNSLFGNDFDEWLLTSEAAGTWQALDPRIDSQQYPTH